MVNQIMNPHWNLKTMKEPTILSAHIVMKFLQRTRKMQLRYSNQKGEGAEGDLMKGNIRSRQFKEERECEACGYATYTFYCLEPFSMGEAACAQCFVDGLIKGRKRVV